MIKKRITYFSHVFLASGISANDVEIPPFFQLCPHIERHRCCHYNVITTTSSKAHKRVLCYR